MAETPWRCPDSDCRGRLATGFDAWACRACGRYFRALRGIPDLRVREDLYLSNEDDWAFARRLDEDYDRLDFRGLLDRYFDLADEVGPGQKDRQIAHILTAPGRVGHWLDALDSTRNGGPILDLGCGSGTFLAAVGRSLPEVCGVDVALRWLLVARKRLEEEGLAHIPLACACAEALPVEDETFTGIVAGDVIEHVGDQAATLAESHRTLRASGRIFLASPNRFSLGAEPHVGAWGVGYLPRRWMYAYVSFATGLDFRAIHTLGLREWERLLSESPFRTGTIRAPRLPADDLDHFGPFKRAVGRLYNAGVATGVGQWMARSIGPLFHVVATKASARGRLLESSPAIRRDSMRTAART